HFGQFLGVLLLRVLAQDGGQRAAIVTVAVRVAVVGGAHSGISSISRRSRWRVRSASVNLSSSRCHSLAYQLVESATSHFCIAWSKHSCGSARAATGSVRIQGS